MSAVQSSWQNVLVARARLGEGPVWDDQNQLLYWIDIYNYRIHQFNPATQTDRHFEVGDAVGCIGLTGSNRLIMAKRKQLAYLDITTGAVIPVMSLELDKPNNRFNDGKCDPAGRFWFGSMCTTGPQGCLYRYDPDGSLSILETGLTISNGLGWSPDN
ncbi:MAG: SMP-30/gluconolactonase/LRE family protein, partial [Cyanothece sp. SIO1E1]|nr:SMP-30/gluconolactonase/LRE family protein [Cyanothece sp. SIO1E1]